jgi:hypothetical protein
MCPDPAFDSGEYIRPCVIHRDASGTRRDKLICIRINATLERGEGVLSPMLNISSRDKLFLGIGRVLFLASPTTITLYEIEAALQISDESFDQVLTKRGQMTAASSVYLHMWLRSFEAFPPLSIPL